MLHLHVAQQLPSLKKNSCTSDLRTNDNDAELKISNWHFSKQNIARLTQVRM